MDHPILFSMCAFLMLSVILSWVGYRLVYKPGQMAPFFSALRAGVGRIRFAGEHTCALAGYMESAVRSGHRAAAQIGSLS